MFCVFPISIKLNADGYLQGFINSSTANNVEFVFIHTSLPVDPKQLHVALQSCIRAYNASPRNALRSKPWRYTICNCPPALATRIL